MPENLYPQLLTAPLISQESFNIEMVRKYYQDIATLNPLRAAVEKSRQCGTSSSHGGRENLTEKHQPVSEGIS